MPIDIVYHNNFTEEKVKEILKSGYLILPCVAYANLDQIVIDVLLYNAFLQKRLLKIATLNSRYVLPIIGSTPFSVDGDCSLNPTTALEMFYIIDSNLIVLQQRSQPKDFMAECFALEMMSFVSSLSPKDLILISSANSTFYDKSIVNDTIAYYTTSSPILSTIGSSIPSINIPSEEMAGSGLLQFYLNFAIKHSILCTAFVDFITEGRNFKDGVLFFNKINKALQFITVDDVKMPPSWTLIDPWLDEDIC